MWGLPVAFCRAPIVYCRAAQSQFPVAMWGLPVAGGGYQLPVTCGGYRCYGWHVGVTGCRWGYQLPVAMRGVTGCLFVGLRRAAQICRCRAAVGESAVAAPSKLIHHNVKNIVKKRHQNADKKK